jgi:hypothetical protein
MKRIHARYLLNYTTQETWEIVPDGLRFILVFDDGSELESTSRQLVYSSYAWEFHRRYPHTPLLPQHHVTAVLKGKPLGSKTHIDLLGQVYWDVVAAYNLDTPEKKDPAVKLIYQITNWIYNDLTTRAERHVMSIDILDFVEVMNHPAIAEVLTGLTPEKDSIQKANQVILDTVYKAPELNHNGLAFAVRAGAVKAQQALQCVGPRGYPSDVDGSILPVPITRGFVQGMRTYYNLLAESRTAAKSLFYSESPLEEAEYFARRLQLICMTVERLYRTDCGSQEYLLWRVRAPRGKGRSRYPGDLEFLEGKWYLDEAAGTLKAIQKTDHHLYDQVIKVRSVLTCKHPDAHGVCEVCFGQLADNIADNENLGHICAATLTQQTSQSVLSLKHHQASSSSEPIALTEHTRQLFRVGKGGTTYYFRKDLATANLVLKIPQMAAFGLTDILLVSDINNINPGRISKIDYIGLGAEGEESEPVYVQQHARSAILTKEFLEFARTNPWYTDSKGNFVFNLAKWDYNKPFLKLPDTEYDFSHHSKQISSMIEAKIENISERMRPESPASTLVELFDLVNSKLSANLSILEVIVYAIMINPDGESGYGLARNAPRPALGVSDLTIKHRSLAAMYAYESQAEVINSPQSYFPLDRPDSPMDVFVTPREVVETYRR